MIFQEICEDISTRFLGEKNFFLTGYKSGELINESVSRKWVLVLHTPEAIASVAK